MFSRFDTVPACDGRTDGRPAYIYYVLHIADARKNTWIKKSIVHCALLTNHIVKISINLKVLGLMSIWTFLLFTVEKSTVSFLLQFASDDYILYFHLITSVYCWKMKIFIIQLLGLQDCSFTCDLDEDGTKNWRLIFLQPFVILRASAMLKHIIDICWTSVRPSVRLSHAGTVSKRLNILSCFLYHTIAHSF